MAQYEQLRHDLDDSERITREQTHTERVRRTEQKIGLDPKAAEAIDKEAATRLQSVGLIYDHLVHRRSLDVGSGSCSIGWAAQLREIDVLSVDNESNYDNYFTFAHRVPYVQGDARALPLANEKFDLAFSTMGPPMTGMKTTQDVRRSIDEVLRVLKPGGEFRFCFETLMGIFPLQQYKGRHLDERIVREWRQKTYDILSGMYPNIRHFPIDSHYPHGMRAGGYYILAKEGRNEKCFDRADAIDEIMSSMWTT